MANHLDSLLANWQSGPMKTTLDLPDELIREVKLRAVVQRRTVKGLVAEFIRAGLGMTPAGRVDAPAAGSLLKIGEGGVPVIRCNPDAPATRMSVEALLAIEQDTQSVDDLKHAGIAV